MSAACVVPGCQRVWLSQSVSSEATRPAVCYGHPSVCAVWFRIHCRAVDSFFLHLLVPMAQLVVNHSQFVFFFPVTEQRKSLLNAALFVLPPFHHVILYGRQILPKKKGNKIIQPYGLKWLELAGGTCCGYQKHKTKTKPKKNSDLVAPKCIYKP